VGVKGQGSNSAGITHMAGTPKGSDIGYHGNNPKAPYIIDYSRNSHQKNHGKSIINRLLGRH
jgi:hypothetical protein